MRNVRLALALLVVSLSGFALSAQSTPGGALPQLFPADNWWNIDISAAPVDTNSAAYIPFMGGADRAMHPDFGGLNLDQEGYIYGIPYVTVAGTTPKKTVQFLYVEESDGVDHSTETSVPFYPIPDEAATQQYWIECGPPGNVDLRDECDRHLLIVDRDNEHLYELYNVFFDGTQWHAGSGAFFDLNANDRRPEGWTSADAAGLAILPGLVRYDEVYSGEPIRHAFRVTVSRTNGHVYPASHTAGDTVGALPMGARLRLKANVDISGFDPAVQRIFQAMKTYGLIVADNGSNMYVQGTHDTRWDNDILNPAFRSLTAGDFEVIQLGWKPAVVQPLTRDANGDGSVNPGDIFYLINHFFAGGPAAVPGFDANDDGSQTIGDVFTMINALFGAG